MTEKEGDKKREVEGEGGRVFNDCVEATPKLPPALLSMCIFLKIILVIKCATCRRLLRREEY